MHQTPLIQATTATPHAIFMREHPQWQGHHECLLPALVQQWVDFAADRLLECRGSQIQEACDPLGLEATVRRRTLVGVAHGNTRTPAEQGGRISNNAAASSDKESVGWGGGGTWKVEAGYFVPKYPGMDSK